MVWCNFLHIFQPPHQLPDILDRIVNESYRPLINGFLANPGDKAVININAGLTELFVNYGYDDLISGVKTLLARGQIELTESAKYHAFLPMLSEAEIERQIKLNHDTNQEIYGEVYKPKGFFAPEMSFDPKIARVVSKMGYRYYLLDEIAATGEVEKADRMKIYKIAGTRVSALFRSRRLSNLIMGAVVRSGPAFLESVGPDAVGYTLTAMDGETFGHHRPGLDKVLFEIYAGPQVESVLASELLNKYPAGGEISPVPSTWASSADEIAKGTHFHLWNNPDNEIHRRQWELTNLAFAVLGKVPPENPAYPELRKLMDESLDSGQFWWASANPWWSLEEIERGAWNTLEVVKKGSEVLGETEALKEGQTLYGDIIKIAFDYQRTGRMRKIIADQKAFLRIPVKVSDPAAFKAAIEVLTREEKEACGRGEYEQAIKWRDAAYKLKKSLDIYDTVAIIDILRAQNRHQDFEDILAKYKAEYDRLQKGQPE